MLIQTSKLSISTNRHFVLFCASVQFLKTPRVTILFGNIAIQLCQKKAIKKASGGYEQYKSLQFQTASQVLFMQEIINYNTYLCEKMGALPQPQTAQQQNQLKQLITLVRKDLQIFQKDLIASQNQLKMTNMLSKNELLNGIDDFGPMDIVKVLRQIMKMYSLSIPYPIIYSLAILLNNFIQVGQAVETTRKLYTSFKERNRYFRLDLYFTTRSTIGFKYGTKYTKSIMGTYYCLSALKDEELTDNQKECLQVMARLKNQYAPQNVMSIIDSKLFLKESKKYIKFGMKFISTILNKSLH